MCAHRISSGTTEHPRPRDAVRVLLARLIEKGSESAWVHFELVPDGSWLSRLIRGQPAWVEVAYENAATLLLNLPVSKKSSAGIPAIPSLWTRAGKGLWIVPNVEIERLVGWIDQYLAARGGRANYQVSGWIDGA